MRVQVRVSQSKFNKWSKSTSKSILIQQILRYYLRKSGFAGDFQDQSH